MKNSTIIIKGLRFKRTDATIIENGKERLKKVCISCLSGYFEEDGFSCADSNSKAVPNYLPSDSEEECSKCFEHSFSVICSFDPEIGELSKPRNKERVESAFRRGYRAFKKKYEVKK